MKPTSKSQVIQKKRNTARHLLHPVLWIRILRIHVVLDHMDLDLDLDVDPDLDLDVDPDPDPSIIKQK
jgi:hypothetical protein